MSCSTIFTIFACPANVQLLDSVSSSPVFTRLKRPANVRLLFAGLGCPAAGQCVQQVSSSTTSTHAGCVCALACFPTAHGRMPTGLKCVEDLQTYMHGMTFGGGVYYMLHTRSSVFGFVTLELDASSSQIGSSRNITDWFVKAIKCDELAIGDISFDESTTRVEVHTSKIGLAIKALQKHEISGKKVKSSIVD